MSLLFNCETCGTAVDADNIGCVENNWCDQCMGRWLVEACAHWKPGWHAEQSYRNSLKLAEEYGKPEGELK